MAKIETLLQPLEILFPAMEQKMDFCTCINLSYFLFNSKILTYNLTFNICQLASTIFVSLTEIKHILLSSICNCCLRIATFLQLLFLKLQFNCAEK